MERRALVLLAALGLVLPGRARPAQDRYITLASTTSTENSGLFGHILPQFEAATGIAVRVVAVGTGQAFEIGRRGDADALLVHDAAAEATFVAEGYGIDRRDVMYNDFVIVGPAADPAAIKGLNEAAMALGRIAAAGAPFASRGDDSGTHRAELRLWRDAGIQPEPGPGWYRALGAGMGATLNAAAGMEAYALTDRATWATFRNQGPLAILVEGDPRLFNQYGSILANPERFPHVKAALARQWHEWLTAPAGQAAIASFERGGQTLFFPNARKSDS
jgi:tungstate transport system substrate-binding protein